MALPDHYEGEDVIVTFEKEYDSTYDSTTRTTAVFNVEGKVLSWNVSGGSTATTDVFAFGGKVFNFAKPREKFSLSFEVMVNNSDFDMVQFGSNVSSAAMNSMHGKMVKSTDDTKRWRVIMWFQEAAYHESREVAAAGGNRSYKVVVPSKSQSLYRMIFCDVKSVTFDKEFSAEDYMKGTLTLEFSAADSDGYANYFEEEGIFSGTTSTTLASMTTTTGTGILRESKGWLQWNTTTANWYSGSSTTDVTQRYRYNG